MGPPIGQAFTLNPFEGHIRAGHIGVSSFLLGFFIDRFTVGISEVEFSEISF